MVNSDNNIIRAGLRALRQRLPFGWTVTEARASNEPTIDMVAEIEGPDQRSSSLALEAKSRLEPRGVDALAESFRRSRALGTPVVISPYLSSSVRARLEQNEIGFVDLTGNVRLAVQSPGLFIDARGASEHPDREERPARSLKGAGAGRLVRALVDFRKTPGVRELGAEAKIDAGYVSRVLALLDSEALVERRRPPNKSAGAATTKVSGTTRTRSGPITHVDWPALLRRWAHDAPLEARGVVRTYLEPRGISPFLARLASSKERYAVSGSIAAARLAPVAPTRLATIWIEDAEAAASRLGLRQTDIGANILLVEPLDHGVFERTVQQGGVVYAAPSQVVADLLTSPGRGPAEAEELIAWMTANEEAWRG